MPLPLLFIGFAALSGSAGVGGAVKAGVDQHHANQLNENSNMRMEEYAKTLEDARKKCGYSLEKLGHEKVYVLNGSVREFLDAFTKIKNVNFRETEGLSELKNLHVDQKDFDSLDELSHFAGTIAMGAVGGAAGGALTALGAYGAAVSFAAASTGTAISTLSGVAATNATLAFFGGGSLAAGGLGVAGGTAVLGGLVAGPALLIMGVILGTKAGKGLEGAKANSAKADEICEEYRLGTLQCVAIRRRAYMFYNLLARLDAYFMPLIHRLEEIVATEGTDYTRYSQDAKKVAASAASIASTIKAVLDIPILTENGDLTEKSGTVMELFPNG